MLSLELQIHLAVSIVIIFFHTVNSIICRPRNADTRGCVNICFVSSCYCRMECKTGPLFVQYPISWSHKQSPICTPTACLSNVRLERTSLINTVHAPVIISLSHHHKQCDNLCETQHENESGVQLSLMWCFTSHLYEGKRVTHACCV